MKVGFTGTRNGMTDDQKRNFWKKVGELSPTEFHHGDCVGADDDAHKGIEAYNFLLGVSAAHKSYDAEDRPTLCKLHIHPPEDDSLQANNEAHVLYVPMTYLARNRQIVEHADIMIACPPTNEEIKRGGTWYTINHSRNRNVPVWILYPDGRVEKQ